MKTWKLEERKSTLIRFLNNIILRWSEEGRLGIWVHSTWSCQVKKSLLFWGKGETMEKAGKVDTTGPSPGIVSDPPHCICGSVSALKSASKVAQNPSCEFLPLLDDSKKWTKWKWNGQSQRSLWILIRKQWKSWQQSSIFSKSSSHRCFFLFGKYGIWFERASQYYTLQRGGGHWVLPICRFSGEVQKKFWGPGDISKI